LIKIIPIFIEKPWAGGHFYEAITPSEKVDKSSLKNSGEMILVSSIDGFHTYVYDTKKSDLPPPLPLSHYSTESNQERLLTFQEYWQKQGYQKAKQLGYKNTYYEESFPFLLKLLSVGDPLSLQVHPSDEDIQKMNLSGYGKFESWYILNTEEKSSLYLGLNQNSIDNINSKLKNIDKEVDPLSLFKKYSPQKNDLIQLLPGIIHGSIGRILFYEIQQPSDYTFRIYDFNRGRKLHIDESLQVIKDITPAIEKNSSGFQHDAFSLKVTKLTQKEKLNEGINTSAIKNTETKLVIKRPFEIITFLPSISKANISIQLKDETLDIHYAETFMFFKGDEITISFSHNINEVLLLRAF